MERQRLVAGATPNRSSPAERAGPWDEDKRTVQVVHWRECDVIDGSSVFVCN
jgi:hypothetical protein